MILQSDLERMLQDDLPYGDLTTDLLGIGGRAGRLEFLTRETVVPACLDEAARVFALTGAKAKLLAKDGEEIGAGETLLMAEGSAASLHAAWKTSQTILEYAGAIATRTAAMVESVRKAGSDIPVMGTRKTFPGGRKLSARAVFLGGGNSHRLGLSETILIFEAHSVFLGSSESEIKQAILTVKRRSPEKKVVIEVSDLESAMRAISFGADILQFDKLSPEEFSRIRPVIASEFPEITCGAAGGVHSGNAGEYALAGADFLVSSWMYAGKAIDIRSVFSAV